MANSSEIVYEGKLKVTCINCIPCRPQSNHAGGDGQEEAEGEIRGAV